MSVLDSVSSELTELEAMEGPEGQVALALARNIDAGRNGMAMQGDSRMLLEVLSVIREATRKDSDSVDDAATRRAAKLHAVG